MSAAGPPAGVVLGLNGAYQRLVQFDKPLTIGAVNRATEASAGVGGKGQGAYLACEAASPGAAVLAQFCGKGQNGEALATALRARAPAVSEQLWVRTAEDTRVCTTLVAAGDATEIVEPSGHVAPDEVSALRDALEARRFGGLLVAGSLPPGVPGSFYARCVATLAPRAKVLVDAVAGLEEIVAEARSAGAVLCLKLNARELLGVAGDALDAAAADTVADGPRAARAAAKLAAHLDAPKATLAAILWTDGPAPGGAYVPKTEGIYAIAGPPLPAPVRSPIGAGDTVAGTTFAAWLSDDGAADDVPAPVRAFAYGLARGAASCLTDENARFDETVAHEIWEDTVVTKM